jgi:hypothetical protein
MHIFWTNQPTTEEHYKVWWNIVPVVTGREEFLVSDLGNPKTDANRISGKPEVSNRCLSGDVCGILSFPGGNPRAQEKTTARVQLSNSKGEPLRGLVPLMGAMAHVVGFSEDGRTVFHIHPESDNSPGEGVSEIEFGVRPRTGGFHKLFVQFQLGSEPRTLFFGISVDQ